MHELSIASGIVDLVEEEVAKAKAVKVNHVEIDIGTLSGVEIHALEFAWEAVTKDTMLEGAELLVNNIEARAKCEECGHRFQLDTFFSPCPECHSFRQDIYQGKELRVKSINVD